MSTEAVAEPVAPESTEPTPQPKKRCRYCGREENPTPKFDANGQEVKPIVTILPAEGELKQRCEACHEYETTWGVEGREAAQAWLTKEEQE